MLKRITPVILTFNEEANIGRTLDKLRWAERVVVLDSLSTDGTRAIAQDFSNVSWFERPFDAHAAQWNHALKLAGGQQNRWILALDADYVLTDEIIEEMAALKPHDNVSAYRCEFDYCVAGKPIRSGIYPSVTVLFRTGDASFRQDGHTQRLSVRGAVQSLKGRIRHDDRKPFKHWLQGQRRYAVLEAQKLLNVVNEARSWSDRLRKLHVVTPWLVPLYCLTVRGGVLDGWRGFYYAFQRGLAETLISWALLEARLRRLVQGSSAL